MINVHKHNGLTWVDLEAPTVAEVRQIMEEYKINSLVADELLSPTLKSKVDLYPDFIYLILHFPALKHTHSGDSNQEIDFIIGRDFIITTRYDTIDPLHKFSKVFEVNSILDRGNLGDHAGFIFFHMVRKLYRALEHELEYIDDSLKAIEEKIFSGKEKEVVYEIALLSRQLLNFHQATSAHREVLESFEEAGRKFFGQEFFYYLRGITGEYFRTDNRIKSIKESLQALKETNDSLLTTRQSEIMKVLTIMAFVTFPLSLIASILSMNTDYLPIVGYPNDFWIVMGIMALATLSFFVFFRYKKWL